MNPYHQQLPVYQFNPMGYGNQGYPINSNPQSLLYSNRKLENMNCIYESSSKQGGLYIGDIISTKKMDLLEKAQIKAILACAVDRIPNSSQSSKFNIQKKFINCSDSMDYPIKVHFEETFQFIENNRQKGKNVLVHCHAGVSRSAAIVCAYLMKKYNWKALQALSFVKRKRQRANPNPNFMNQLLQYQKQLLSNIEKYITHKTLDRSLVDNKINENIKQTVNNKEYGLSNSLHRVSHRFQNFMENSVRHPATQKKKRELDKLDEKLSEHTNQIVNPQKNEQNPSKDNLFSEKKQSASKFKFKQSFQESKKFMESNLQRSLYSNNRNTSVELKRQSPYKIQLLRFNNSHTQIQPPKTTPRNNQQYLDTLKNKKIEKEKQICQNSQNQNQNISTTNSPVNNKKTSLRPAPYEKSYSVFKNQIQNSKNLRVIHNTESIRSFQNIPYHQQKISLKPTYSPLQIQINHNPYVNKMPITQNRQMYRNQNQIFKHPNLTQQIYRTQSANEVGKIEEKKNQQIPNLNLQNSNKNQSTLFDWFINLF